MGARGLAQAHIHSITALTYRHSKASKYLQRQCLRHPLLSLFCVAQTRNRAHEQTKVNTVSGHPATPQQSLALTAIRFQALPYQLGSYNAMTSTRAMRWLISLPSTKNRRYKLFIRSNVASRAAILQLGITGTNTTHNAYLPRLIKALSVVKVLQVRQLVHHLALHQGLFPTSRQKYYQSPNIHLS